MNSLAIEPLKSPDNNAAWKLNSSPLADGKFQLRIVRADGSPIFDGPFARAAKRYRAAGWLGTLPLPAGAKTPPPAKFTGHTARYPDDVQVARWRAESRRIGAKREGANIALRLAGIEIGDEAQADRFEIVGIDVDHYVKGVGPKAKVKRGGDQLAALESKFGTLPSTWISSARTDGFSGIRYYRVPAGFKLRGQVDKDIECIYRGYRFAVVWPSTNPDHDDCLYWWFPPGAALTEDGRAEWNPETDALPEAHALPLLPDAWVDYLSNGRMRSDDNAAEMDTDSSVADLRTWADETFNDSAGQCARVAKSVADLKAEITSEATSHDKIVKAHWHLYRLAAEGHTGWKSAIAEIEAHWTAEVIERDKRGRDELKREVWRSRTNALRRIKKQVEANVAIGAVAVPPDLCDGTPVPRGNPTMTAPSPTPASPSSIKPDLAHSGQVRIAYRLQTRYADKLLHVEGIGWHFWDGKRWLFDGGARQAKRGVLDILRRAYTTTIGNPSEDAKKLRSDIKKCESANGLAGVLSVAAALPKFAADARDLDADPYLINVANGTLDLHTGKLRAHNPADRITKICRGAFQPDAPGPNWDAFLTRVLPDADVLGFMQRLVGVGLLGTVREHVLPILTGTGANGKSVFDKAIRFALGDYAIAAEPDLFMHREGAHPTGEMDLRGVRWVSVSESDKDRRLAEATVKRLTGGDTVRARRMRQDFVEFDASHSAVLITNHLPKVSGDDPAIWRRLRVVPFDVVIPEHEQDGELGEKLAAEADAILSWAGAGLRAYLAGGLAEPARVRAATDGYHLASDSVSRFISECCATGKLAASAARATTSDLHDAFRRWQIQDGCEPLGRKAFGLALDAKGYPSGAPSQGKRYRRGIALSIEWVV